MKPLEQFTNNEKAKLLHDLFPGEIEVFIEFAEGFAYHTIINGGRLDAEWLRFAEKAKTIIEKYGIQLSLNSQLFSDQLFDGTIANWTIDTLLKYISLSGLTNNQFREMVKILFW